MSGDVKFGRGIPEGHPAYAYQREISRSETVRPATTASPWIKVQRPSDRWHGCGSGGGQAAYSFPFVPRIRYAIHTSFLAAFSRTATEGCPLGTGLPNSVVADADKQLANHSRGLQEFAKSRTFDVMPAAIAGVIPSDL